MDWLFTALGHLLFWFSSIMPNNSYALALVLYALVFKLLFLPFSIKQQKTQIKMAKLTPKIELIKAKYKGRNDQVTRQKMQQEIMELQQKEGASPLAGCLPMLLQLPIILWLYKVIRNPLSYICGMDQAAFDGYFGAVIKAGIPEADILALKQDQLQIISFMKNHAASVDYTQFLNGRELPNLNLFGLDLGMTPSLSAGWPLILVCLIPVFAAAIQWLSMFLSRKWNSVQQVTPQDDQANASMKMMDLMMPLMTLFICFSFTALMGLYWIWQSVFAILQTFILSRAMPLPTYTEEELKAMRKEQKKMEKDQKKALKGGARYKSLHYIDEDDYDELPQINDQDPSKSKSNFSGDAPEIKD